MGEDEIKRKLGMLLAKPIADESLVVHFMVLSRKLLDRLKARGHKDYSVVRFYADWCVHTEKDRLTSTIKAAMRQIEKALTEKEEDFNWHAWNEHVNFIQFTEFRRELVSLLSHESQLSTDAIDEPEMWQAFVSSLVGVLVDQPIKKPSKAIEYFCFRPSPAGRVTWAIKMSHHPKEFIFEDRI